MALFSSRRCGGWPNQGRAGLTLLEVLVAIGVVALLAGLLVPTIGWARTKAKQSACTSNLAQLGGAILIYAEHEGGRLPASQNWKATKPERSSAWFAQLPRLMNERKINRPGTIFQCPSFSGAPPGLISNEVPKSYKMNEDLDRVRGPGRSFRHKPFFINQLTDAQQVVLFFDGIATGGKGQWGYGGTSEIDDSRHLSWVGVLMADGRVVRALPTSELRAGSPAVRWTSIDWK
jgi:prepilin-type N-terminal cleavage/methylation domain-containing protein